MSAPQNEAWCYEVFRRVRWPRGLQCPHCRQRWVTSHSKSSKTPRRRYLCFDCRRTFTDLSGTPLARTHLSLATWFRGLHLIEQDRSTAELAKELDIKWDTAARLRQRIERDLRPSGFVERLRQAMRTAGYGKLGHCRDAADRDARRRSSR